MGLGVQGRAQRLGLDLFFTEEQLLVGLDARGDGLAVEAGRSTLMSTVARGAATMKMISSTSITSMNGVTLIS